jgi:hypothetical protein
VEVNSNEIEERIKNKMAIQILIIIIIIVRRASALSLTD